MPAVPPFGDATDEALSALLDGELGEFARARGITEDSVREQLESWPGYAARRAELEHTAAALHVPTPPLDDLTRRRLVRTATNAFSGRADTPRRPRSWVAITAVAAAGLLVLIGIGAAIASFGGDSAGDTAGRATSSADAGAPAPLRGDVGNLGDVTDPEALRALLDRREAATGDDATERGEDPGFENPTSGATDLAPPPAANTIDPESCARTLAPDGDLTFSGTGSYRGAPVTIVGITEGARTIVFVVSGRDCANVLASVSR